MNTSVRSWEIQGWAKDNCHERHKNGIWQSLAKKVSKCMMSHGWLNFNLKAPLNMLVCNVCSDLVLFALLNVEFGRDKNKKK